MSTHGTVKPESYRSELGDLRGALNRVGIGLAVVGSAAAAAHGVLAGDGIRRFMLAYLVAFAFVLSLSLGALFFVLIQHLFRSGWSVLLRRLPEAMAANLWLVALMFLPIGASVLMGQGDIYPWARPVSAKVEHHEPAVPMKLSDEKSVTAPHDTKSDQTHATADHKPGHHDQAATGSTISASPMGDDQGEHAHAAVVPGYTHQQLDDFTMKKRPWLNQGFFVGRWVVYLGIWAMLGWWFWKQSVKQDATSDWTLTSKMESLAPPMMLVFALTVTLASFDLLMSLNPQWYSTIYGVYYFSGCVVGSLSLVILLVLWLSGKGRLGGVGVEHQHDLGKLLFAFVFFWGYIAYSQYMLLWYANMPEFTAWYKIRGATTVAQDINGWTAVVLLLLVGHFVAPFAMLLSRHVKRRALLLAMGAVWMLAMHWLDLVWLVMPELGPGLVAIGLMEVGLTLALGGVYLIGVGYMLSKAGLVPVGDPRLSESVAFENI